MFLSCRRSGCRPIQDVAAAAAACSGNTVWNQSASHQLNGPCSVDDGLLSCVHIASGRVWERRSEPGLTGVHPVDTLNYRPTLLLCWPVAPRSGLASSRMLSIQFFIIIPVYYLLRPICQLYSLFHTCRQIWTFNSIFAGNYCQRNFPCLRISNGGHCVCVTDYHLSGCIISIFMSIYYVPAPTAIVLSTPSVYSAGTIINGAYRLWLWTNLELIMYKLLSSLNLSQTFPIVEIALRIYLCMMVSNASGERSFSKLERVKGDLRSSMGQERLEACWRLWA